uniref:Unknow protein n=1 Tax=Solanum tuberosum TaxID=4113 RepID=M1BMP2_SOLTU
MSSPGGILNALATALHGSIRTAPSIHRLRLGLLGYLIPFAPLAFVSQCQCRPSRVLSPLVFFPISTHFTAPPEIPSAPTVLQLELADAYSPDTVIASSPGKEVHDPWAFYLHAALLRQAFAHCGKFPTAASRRSLGRVSVPVWLIILSDQLLIIALPFPAVVPLPRAGSYALLTRPPLETPFPVFPVRLACVKHAASVHPEPGSNLNLERNKLEIAKFEILQVMFELSSRRGKEEKRMNEQDLLQIEDLFRQIEVCIRAKEKAKDTTREKGAKQVEQVEERRSR